MIGKNAKVLALAVIAAGMAGMPSAAIAANGTRMGKSEVIRASAAEIASPIRPGGVDGRPFWNGYSIFFQYPPVLEFKPVKGAARYVAKVYSDVFRSWEVACGEKPWADLTTVWPKLGANGFVHVVCRGLRVDGTVCGLAGERAFMKTASFTGDYPRAKWSYAEAARRIYDFVFNATPQAEFRRTGKPYPEYRKNCYPAKMDSALIEMCLAYAGIRPERKAEAMKFACTLCDYLMSVSEPAGAPLAHLAPTYLSGFGHPVADAYCAQTMMLEPVKVVMASLRLSQALRRENPALAKKYLDYAENGAATLAKHQLPDGSWYLRLALKTGRPPELVKSGETSELRFQEGVDLRQNRVFPLSFATMFDALAEETGKDAYRQAAKRALDYVLREGGPMATYNWEGQFEDGPPTPPYMNLSKHPACDCAIYLLQKFPDDPKRVAEARELARFAEDQFVLWELPVRRDGAIMSPATCPRIGENKPFAWNLSTCRSWHVPGALEQYDCYNPIDASNAKLVRTFLALYRVTKNPLDLEKARAMADSIVNMTPENGDLPTHWRGKWSEQENWTNCMLHAADALVELSQEVEGR